MTLPILTAKEFERRLTSLAPDDAEMRQVRMGDIFKLGKEFQQMPVGEIEKLMESEVHKSACRRPQHHGPMCEGQKLQPRTPSRAL